MDNNSIKKLETDLWEAAAGFYREERTVPPGNGAVFLAGKPSGRHQNG